MMSRAWLRLTLPCIRSLATARISLPILSPSLGNTSSSEELLLSLHGYQVSPSCPVPGSASLVLKHPSSSVRLLSAPLSLATSEVP